jgi:hypothetical protein
MTSRQREEVKLGAERRAKSGPNTVLSSSLQTPGRQSGAQNGPQYHLRLGSILVELNTNAIWMR